MSFCGLAKFRNKHIHQQNFDDRQPKTLKLPKLAKVQLRLSPLALASCFSVFVGAAQANIIIPSANYGGYAASANAVGESVTPSWLTSGTHSGVIGDALYSATSSGVTNSISAFTQIGTADASANTTSTLEYFFNVVGPSTTKYIPLQMTYSVNFSGTGNFFSFADITYPYISRLGTMSSTLEQYCAAGGAGLTSSACPYGPYISGSITNTVKFKVTPNSDFPLALSMEVGAFNNYNHTGNEIFGQAYGKIDPYITIDPTFANAKQYSIVFSSGVQNGTPTTVPEPSSLLIMLGGLGFASVLLPFHRRRRLIR